jgi:hypothetical protein
VQDQETLTRLIRIERKLDQLLDFFVERDPSDEQISDAVERFIEDSLLPKWLAD